MQHLSPSAMTGLSGANSARSNSAARKGRAVRQEADRVVAVRVVVAVDKAEAVQVVKEARAEEADVRVASAALRRAQRPDSQPRCLNKIPLLMAHGVCGSG